MNSRCHSSNVIIAQILTALSSLPSSLAAMMRRTSAGFSKPRSFTTDGESNSSTVGRSSPTTQERMGGPNTALGRQMTSCGSTGTMLRLKMYLRVSLRSFSSGGIRALERDELVVQQRDANLRRRRHAHLVGVAEVEARKERLEV